MFTCSVKTRHSQPFRQLLCSVSAEPGSWTSQESEGPCVAAFRANIKIVRRSEAERSPRLSAFFHTKTLKIAWVMTTPVSNDKVKSTKICIYPDRKQTWQLETLQNSTLFLRLRIVSCLSFSQKTWRNRKKKSTGENSKKSRGDGALTLQISVPCHGRMRPGSSSGSVVVDPQKEVIEI